MTSTISIIAHELGYQRSRELTEQETELLKWFSIHRNYGGDLIDNLLHYIADEKTTVDSVNSRTSNV